jgi:hypothetical protein
VIEVAQDSVIRDIIKGLLKKLKDGKIKQSEFDQIVEDIRQDEQKNKDNRRRQ